MHTPTSILHEKLQFLKRLIILVFHLASLSLAVYFRPADMDAVLLQWPEEITDVVRIAAECSTVLGVLSYILVQLGGEMINIGPLSFLKQLVGRHDLFPRSDDDLAIGDASGTFYSRGTASFDIHGLEEID